MIQEKYPEDYHLKFGDQHTTLGSYDGEDVYVKVVELVKNYDEKPKEQPLKEVEADAKVDHTDDGETCIAICFSFQRRVNMMIPQSGDRMMKDANSNVDLSDTKVFHLMCPSSAGGLPIATFVTTHALYKK